MIIPIQNTASGQLIQIPDTLKIDDNKVFLKKVGNIIYIIPFHNPWQMLIDSLTEFSSDFMEDRNQPNKQERTFFD